MEPDDKSAQANPIRILRRAWPDIILANSRILKLKIRAIYETPSIKIKNGMIGSGAPEGRNKLFSCQWCVLPPIMFTPKKCINDKNSVTTNELVTVKENGNKPIIFKNNNVLNK